MQGRQKSPCCTNMFSHVILLKTLQELPLSLGEKPKTFLAALISCSPPTLIPTVQPHRPPLRSSDTRLLLLEPVSLDNPDGSLPHLTQCHLLNETSTDDAI